MILHDHHITTIRILSVLIDFFFSFAELLAMGFGGASAFKAKFIFIIVKFIMRDLTHCL